MTREDEGDMERMVETVRELQTTESRERAEEAAHELRPCMGRVVTINFGAHYLVQGRVQKVGKHYVVLQSPHTSHTNIVLLASIVEAKLDPRFVQEPEETHLTQGDRHSTPRRR